MTAQMYNSPQYDRAKVFFSPERKGKSAAINRVVPLIESPIIIFTDANTMINDLSVSLIVEEFQDSKVGCVAGEKRISMSDKESLSSGGEGIYWKYESFLKDMDSRLYSAVGAAGELFAIRRSLYEEMPPIFCLMILALNENCSQGICNKILQGSLCRRTRVREH